MLVESIGFMDALSSAVVIKKDPKKRKRLSSNSSAKKDEPESPKIETKPLKFYKDTLEEEDEPTNGEKSPTKEIETSTVEKEIKTEVAETMDTSENETEVKAEKIKSEDEEEEVKRAPGIGCGPDGPPGVLVDLLLPRRKKRSIRWKPEEDLTEIRFFELDENERTNVTKTSFTEQKQMEHVAERSAFQLGRKLQNEDTMAEQTTWRALIIVDNVPEIAYGVKSREISIQAEREKTVLQELYFRTSMNDSPHEPDPESYEHMEPQIMPQEDLTGNPDSVNNFKDVQWPAPKGELPVTFLSNAFSNVFNSISIPPAIGIPSAVGLNHPMANPLANFPLGLAAPIAREPQNPMVLNQWALPPASFMQPPPTLLPPAASAFVNRGASNNFNRSNNTINRGGSNNGNWVRGNANARRGTCNKFQRTGFCPNKSCPYIHER